MYQVTFVILAEAIFIQTWSNRHTLRIVYMFMCCVRWNLYGDLLITIVYISIENTDKLLCAIWSLGNVTHNELLSHSIDNSIIATQIHEFIQPVKPIHLTTTDSDIWLYYKFIYINCKHLQCFVILSISLFPYISCWFLSEKMKQTHETPKWTVNIHIIHMYYVLLLLCYKRWFRWKLCDNRLFKPTFLLLLSIFRRKNIILQQCLVIIWCQSTVVLCNGNGKWNTLYLKMTIDLNWWMVGITICMQI